MKKSAQRFDLDIVIAWGEPPYQKSIDKVEVNGIARFRDGELNYEIDQLFVNWKECRKEVEAINGNLKDDPRFDGPIMAHIEKMDWNITRELDPTDLKQDAA